MNEEAVTALREWCANHQYSYVARRFGDVEVHHAPDGPLIVRADPTMSATMEVLEDAVAEFVTFAVEDIDGEPFGVLTIRATNATLRYQVLGLDVPRDLILCERIIEP